MFSDELLALLHTHADPIDGLDDVVVEVLREPFPLFENLTEPPLAFLQRLFRSRTLGDVFDNGHDPLRGPGAVMERRGGNAGNDTRPVLPLPILHQPRE